MLEEFEAVYEALRAWCRARGYAGHDPFDAVNSRLFQSTPLRRSRLARLAWTQILKRSPFNLRALALVPAGKNPKGTALFALATLARLRTTRGAAEGREARSLLDDLLDSRVRSPGGHGAWGYNFDWQGRAFYAPRGTPAVVPTAFAVRALVEGTLATRAARYVVRRQRDDGSWAYGADSYQSWSDNFHTAFVLTSLARILKACGPKMEEGDGDEIRGAVARGYEFWRGRFFLADGWPKYYHHSAHPADAHSAGAAVVACVELRDIEPGAPGLATRVARWAVSELFDSRGVFYYQKRPAYTARTPYMRWSQAWMMYALARLLEMMNAER